MQKKSDNSDTTKSALSRYKFVPRKLSSQNTNEKLENEIDIALQGQNLGENEDSCVQKEMIKTINAVEKLTEEITVTGEIAADATETTNTLTWIIYLLTLGTLVIGISSLQISASVALLQNNSAPLVNSITEATFWADFFLKVILVGVILMLVVYIIKSHPIKSIKTLFKSP